MNIAVLLSGGVDSSVALALLREQGVPVTACYLKIWLEDELSFLGSCPWEDDLTYVRAVCAQYDVSLEIVPLQRAYWERVVTHTIDEIKLGRTPNPDIWCNQRIKFGMFFDQVGMQVDRAATGHYARVEHRDDRWRLLCAPDPVKDQTYFLSFLSQEQLSRALFPIGHLAKAEVRALAERYNLPNKQRKDSQGICFLGKLKFSEFIKYHLGELPGKLVEAETGAVVGEHKGYWFYTLGQRQGIGLSGGPWYVVKKNIEENIVYVSRTYHDEDKARDTFTVGECNWIGTVLPDDGGPVTVKLRHGPQRHECTVARTEQGQLAVTLATRDQGIAPGQYAVFYRDDECLGAGVIE